jgi:hypothetical protein
MFTKLTQKYDLPAIKKDLNKLDNWLFSKQVFILLILGSLPKSV